MTELPRERLRSLVEHDLRTPLAVIVGYAELLQVRDDGAFRLEAAARITEAAERLSAGLDELLDARFPPPRADPGSSAPPENGEREVLLVDDDDAVRALLRATLPADGYVVSEAASAAEALERISESVPDLVLLDWQMPGASGGDLLADVKKRHPEVPVIILTADPRRASSAANLGADAFLTKPFSPRELLAAVERLAGDRPRDERA